MKISHPQRLPIHRLLVVMPTWLGDSIMAMPTLQTLRAQYPDAKITVLLRRNLRPLVDACPWVDRMVTRRPGRESLFALARRLSAGRFDTAILLPNSFRSALLTRLAGIPRRIGYDRDGRGSLLTDRLMPRRDGDGFIPVPTRDYYLAIAQYLGAQTPDPNMQLFTHADDDLKAHALWQRAGVDVLARTAKTPLILLNPGSAKLIKCWPAARFAALADRLIREHNAAIAITGAPNERAILDAVLEAAHEPIIDLTQHGLSLRLLKSVIRRADLLITNDTGTRHLAAAMQVPVVTLFGPTTPDWTEIDYAWERQVQAQTLEAITVDQVVDTAIELWRLRARTTDASVGAETAR